MNGKNQSQGCMVLGSNFMEMDPITEMESLARVCGRGTEACGHYARAEEGLSTKFTVGFNIYSSSARCFSNESIARESIAI